MDRRKGPQIAIGEESSSSLCDEQSIDRASSNSTSTDGLSSGDGDLTSSPIDLICDQTPGNGSSSDDDCSPLGWPLARQERSRLKLSPVLDNAPSEGFPVVKPAAESSNNIWVEKREKRETTPSEIEMMKERFSKLLLGEDMSGSGKGVCTALAISNAITNLAASVFGELWRLEPLATERKKMWAREMEWLLSVSDYIVEFVPSFHSVSDGSSLEVMISRPRSDLYINLPALRKLDAMLLESLDSFKATEFWYVDQGVTVSERESQKNLLKAAATIKRQDDKWWLPVPKIPTTGLSEKARKALQYQRDCTSQILKAAMAINEQVLSEMQVPQVYWDSLPKNARSSLGEGIHHALSTEYFSPDALLSSLDLSTEHAALEVGNRIQAAVHVWRRKVPKDQLSGTTSRYPWIKVRDTIADSDRRCVLIERADSLLLTLRQRFPGLPQTVLDVNKIQFNKDVGQAILESYSRVLESLAFSISSRIDDVLYIADMTKRNNHATSVAARKSVPTPFSAIRISTTNTPYVTPFASPSSASSSPSITSPSNAIAHLSSQHQHQHQSSASGSALGSGSGSGLGSGSALAPALAPAPASASASSGVCPFLGSLCSIESSDDVKESKKPGIHHRDHQHQQQQQQQQQQQHHRQQQQQQQ